MGQGERVKEDGEEDNTTMSEKILLSRNDIAYLAACVLVGKWSSIDLS